jgi:hypothetical protein
MHAVEFTTELSDLRLLPIPPEVADQLPKKGRVRIIVLTDEPSRDAEWRKGEANDLAVLKITGGTFAPLPIAPSRKMRLGQVVATIGFPNIEIQGFSPKVTRGEISSLNGIGDDPRA